MESTFYTSIIQQLQEDGYNHNEILDIMNQFIQEDTSMSDNTYNKITNRLKLEILDIDRFIRVNNCQPITNPILYNRNNIPTDDGLLSYKIFGMTQDDKMGIFAYIDLGQYYIDPSCCKAWYNIDKRIKSIVHKEGFFNIDPKGFIVEDPRGYNGIEWLRKNINRINFNNSKSKSIKRNIKVQYLELNRSKMFINKYLVIPALYRDTNSMASRKGSVGVGKINKLYQQLIIGANSLKATQEYGFDMSGAMQGRMQETLIEIYDWFCGNNNKNIQKKEEGYGLSGKTGVIRRANASKTTNFAARVVISAPELKANSPKDMMTNFEYSAIPLAAAIACFAPFIQFNIRRFFENEFMGTEQYAVVDSDGKVHYEIPKDPLITFSDERIKKEMNHFIHGYNNRLVPIEVPLENGKTAYMIFKGRYQVPGTTDIGVFTNDTIYNRRLTWLDILFMAAERVAKDHMVLISRFPIDTRTNQFASKFRVLSMNETEPMIVGDEFYKWYPKFSDKDIGKDTSNMFIDTLNLSNLYLIGCGGDYDGDQCTIRGVFTEEANNELKEFVKEKKNFIGFGAKNLRIVEGDSIQSVYSLTKILVKDKDQITKSKFA